MVDVYGRCVHQWALSERPRGWCGRCQVCGLAVTVEASAGGRTIWEWAYGDGSSPAADVMLEGVSSVMMAYRARAYEGRISRG